MPESNHLPLPLRSTGSTIADVINWHATRNPGRPAIVGSNFVPFCYRELISQIKQISNQLHKAGIGSSSRIGILLPRGPEAAILGVAVASHAISVPLNPILTPREIEEELARFCLDALIIPSWVELPNLAASQERSLSIFKAKKAGSSLSNIALEQICDASPSPLVAANLSRHSVALLLKTSGTTGLSKLVPVTHENLLTMAHKMQQWFALSADDRCACILPPYFAHGFKQAILVPLLLGGSIALPANPNDITEWITDLRPSWFSASPTYLQALLDRLRTTTNGKLKHSLRFVLSGASALQETLQAELEAILKVPVLEVYGSSEAGVMSANPAPPAKRKPGTVGLFNPDELAIKDNSTGTLLPTGAIGEIVVRGPSVMPGYINDVNSADEGDENSWFCTGDLGFVDSDGFLTITGRTKELINRGGEKISPHDIEKVLHNHPSVREAAAFPIAHPRLGENVAAAVVLKSGVHATASELKAFLQKQLARTKVPQEIFIMSNLPRGSTGKVLRSQLSKTVSISAESIAPIEPLEVQIAGIWRKLLKRTNIGIDEDFFKAGGDSIQAVEVLLEIEALTGQRISEAEFTSALTIRELAAATVRSASRRDEMITCVKGGKLTPYFFCHGDYGAHGFYARKLADLLGDDQPVFLIRPYRHSDAGARIAFEEMARSYLPQLLTIHPSGSYRLGGFCNGGSLAWELAHQLIKAGREVEFVILCDTISLNARNLIRTYARILSWMVSIFPEAIGDKIKRDGMAAVWGETWNRPGQIVQTSLHLIWRAINAIFRAAAVRQPTMPTDKKIVLSSDDPVYYRAMANYIPPKINSTVFCVLSEEGLRLEKFSASPWKHLAREVHVEYVAGEHLNCITTHISGFANIVNSILCRTSKTFDRREEQKDLCLRRVA